MLWLLQPSAPSRIQQKVFPEDDPAGMQSKTVPIREAKPEDNLVHDLLTGPTAYPRYLLIPAVLEPCDGDVRQGHGAKEV